MWNILEHIKDQLYKVECSDCKTLYKKRKDKLKRDTCKNCRVKDKMDAIDNVCKSKGFIFLRDSYVSSRVEISVICNHGHKFYVRPDNALYGLIECSVCRGIKVEEKKKKLSINLRPPLYINNIPIFEEWWIQKSGKIRQSILKHLRNNNYCYCITCKLVKNITEFSSLHTTTCIDCKKNRRKQNNINNYNKIL